MPTLTNESDQAHSLNYSTAWRPNWDPDGGPDSTGDPGRPGVTPQEFYAVSGGAALHLLPGESVEIPQGLADALTNAATSAGLVIE